MTYEKAVEIQLEICDRFFFNRKNREVFAGDFEDEPEPSDLVYDIFGEVFAVNVINSLEGAYVIELMSQNDDLYITPIIEFFGLNKTDIVSTKSEKFELQVRKRPLEIGCSIGPLVENWGGTLGCFVKDIDDGNNYILSNHHVLFSDAGNKDNFIVQPSTSNGGKKEDAIGLFVRSIRPDPSGVNNFDAALAGPISIEMQKNIPSVGSPIMGVKSPTIGMKVYKVGIKTGKTFGVIRSINSGLKVEDDNGVILDYQDQIVISGTKEDFSTPDFFSQAGDSGSVVLEYGTNMLVGLHFCGNGTLYSCSNKIDPLFSKLRVSL
ncbi:S1 family peptidase [Ferruginibacter lapsinanis]|uniref:S1 family peptidase n=1 Tax=Ferruginibacter lapsinanis TaxID=563172 RepID=UPI001E3E4533|nr:S1 family peptidase [Ferruginibacter lapsinanis]UEG49371.1 S1 family peptidase [Ferruginibacter lapsinanis]